ncbi:MAG TPA: hypothetical protein VHO69_03955 [Phototrophicaceae bacterium]|nr:hypothetical protein [Phototrophicaceae bacterium]
MKFPHLFLTLVALLFALPTLPMTAQDTSAGWPVETRCVGEPTTPPEGWTFPGAILMGGPYGIHGLKADWDTTHVLAFTGGYDLIHANGGLSPDMKWLLAAAGDVECSGGCFHPTFYINKLLLFNITGINPREVYTIPWNFSYTDSIALWGIPPIVWTDNEHIVYPIQSEGWSSVDNAVPYTLNPFTQEKKLWGNKYYLRTSPDHSRNLVYDEADNLYRLQDAKSGEIIRTFDLKEFLPMPEFTQVWSPNSAYFLNIRRIEEYIVELVLFDRNGVLNSSVLTINTHSPNPFYLPNDLSISWSPNSDSFWMKIYDESPDRKRYMVNLPNQRLTDLCLPLDKQNMDRWEFVWSPEGNQLATTIYQGRNELSENLVFDLVDWKLYRIGYIDGSVFGWRED